MSACNPTAILQPATRQTLPAARSTYQCCSRLAVPRQHLAPRPAAQTAAARQHGCSRRQVVAAAIKPVEAFDAPFELDEKQQAIIDELLYSEMFCAQVARECKLPEGTVLEFTGELFQPIPWTVTTKKGMPAALEKKYHGKEEYTFINVPPVFMFQAKIFSPPRLCAIYKRK